MRLDLGRLGANQRGRDNSNPAPQFRLVCCFFADSVQQEISGFGSEVEAAKRIRNESQAWFYERRAPPVAMPMMLLGVGWRRGGAWSLGFLPLGAGGPNFHGNAV
jgi:hypothetical protein